MYYIKSNNPYICHLFKIQKPELMRSQLTRKALSIILPGALIISCQSLEMHESAPQTGPIEVGLYAGGHQTRTMIQPDGLSAVWESGDQLALWAKNSSGDFTLDNQIFKAHGLDGKRGFFTSELAEAMPQGTYTYFCCYPVPAEVNGTEATFCIPSVQDGKASAGVDVMIATPVLHQQLTAFPDPNDHTTMKMELNRMMHQFRFYVPQEDNLLGEEKIERLYMTFPTAVVGNVTCDLQNPGAPVHISEGQSDVTLELAQPIGVSNGDAYEFACLAFAPVQFPEGQSLQITKAYTDDKIVIFDPIDLKGKNCLPGHSTPVKLKIRDLVDYAGIINLTLGMNNLGENPRKITLTAPEGCKWGESGSNVYVYEPGYEIPVGETLSFKFETDLQAYMAFSEKSITVTYDSENALMNETLTMPAITGMGQTSLSMTVPYLLFEDFSCIYKEGESYGNNSYSSSEREQPGYSLDDYMSHKGWNAARYWMKKGSCVRINTRYQEVKIIVSFASTHYGRLDTPQLSGIKPGKTVNVDVIFDAGGNRNSGSSLTLSDPVLAIATHSKTGVLNGIPTGATGITSKYDTTIADFGTTHERVPVEDNCGNDAFGETFTTRSAVLNQVNSENRICFYVDYRASSGTGNCEFNVYIDNIKVQIAN